MNKRGMTITEVAIIVAIIGLIAAIAIPNFARMREKSLAELCEANREMITSAKRHWQIDTGAADDAEPTEEDLADYIQGGYPDPVIPGAIYTIGNLLTPVACSVHAPGDGVYESGGSDPGPTGGSPVVGELPIEVGEDWAWLWEKGFFNTFDFAAEYFEGDDTATYSMDPGIPEPQLEINGTTLTFASLSYQPEVQGIDVTGVYGLQYIEVEVQYSGVLNLYDGDMFVGQAQIIYYPDDETLTYMDRSVGEYGEHVLSTGQIRFENIETGIVTYVNIEDIP
jgi:competence protein ComGC